MLVLGGLVLAAIGVLLVLESDSGRQASGRHGVEEKEHDRALPNRDQPDRERRVDRGPQPAPASQVSPSVFEHVSTCTRGNVAADGGIRARLASHVDGS